MNQLLGRSGAFCFSLLLTAALHAQSTGGNSNLLSRSDWVRIDIVGGRITAHHALHACEKTATVQQADGACIESLSVHVCDGQPNVKYECHDQQHNLTVQITEGTNVVIRRRANDGSANDFEFEQQSDGQNTLTVFGMQTTEKIASKSFWHLMLAERTLCAQHLIPVLERLRTDWRLLAYRDEIQAELLGMGQSPQVPSRRDIDTLLRQLGNRRYQVRRAADRQIREMGQYSFYHLSQLNPSTLTADQQLHVAEILGFLSPQVADTPRQVAARMTGDAPLLAALLNDSEPANRQIAHAHLTRLYETPMAFDPQGDEKTRQVQIVELKKKLGIR